MTFATERITPLLVAVALTACAGKEAPADPAVGRAAIADKARGFMAAFPDMVVRLDSIAQVGKRARFHWTWTGTNTGPGGTGKAVRISGYEDWTMDPDGLILESDGHYDEAEYQRQMRDGGEG